MASYLELRTDIGDELARDDLTPKIPRFIRQATQRINRQVRIADLTRRARASGENSPYLACPADFRGMRRMWNVVSAGGTEDLRYRINVGDYSIKQVPPGKMRLVQAGGRLPFEFCVHRNDPPEIEFNVALSDQREVEMVYMVRFAEFTADTDTNWLLDNHYDAYFSAALYHAYKYVRDEERAAMHAADWARVIEELQEDQDNKDYMQPLETRAIHNVV